MIYISKKTDSKQFLDKVLKLNNINEYEIIKNKYGKPYLKDNNLYFNISHSKDLIICIISNQEVGIDIQYKKEIDYQKIAKKICTEDEINYIDSLDKFYEVWTKKEAYIKYLGTDMYEEKISVLKTHNNNYEFITQEYNNYIITIYKPIQDEYIIEKIKDL